MPLNDCDEANRKEMEKEKEKTRDPNRRPFIPSDDIEDANNKLQALGVGTILDIPESL